MGQYTNNDKLFRAIIEKQLTYYGMNKVQLAKKIGISKTSLYTKYKKPDTFSILELRRIHQVLRFTEAERKILL